MSETTGQKLTKPRLGIPDTLVVEYTDGSKLKIPYNNRDDAAAFLANEGDHVKDYWLEPYAG